MGELYDLPPSGDKTKNEYWLTTRKAGSHAAMQVSKSSLSRMISALAITATLAGCSTLPRDGPTGRAVERGASTAGVQGSYAIVDLDYSMSEAIKALPAQFLGSLVSGLPDTSTGLIGPGDVLSVSIFEPSGSLFGGGAINQTSVRGGSQALPGIVVDSGGSATVPFAGAVRVAGLTPPQAGAAIRSALIGKVGNPQVVVSVSQNSFNTVTVLGEVREPGRAPLASNADRLVDIIANRGGVSKPAEDVNVVLRRDNQTFTAPLTVVMSNFEENIALKRGDQINLIYAPRFYSTFGALGAVARVEMNAGQLNLAGALSRVGGLDTNSANARSVLVFRFERPDVAAVLGVAQPAQARGVPIIYRLNLEEAEGMFVANNFQIQADDIVYVPRSGSAELGKFFTLVQTVTRVVYDVSVTSTLSNN